MIKVELAFSPAPRVVETVSLSLPAGSRLVDALRASGWLDRHGLDLKRLACGVWGRRQPLEHPLREGDRVEVYRPLLVDPKQARRERYKKDRPRKTKRPADAGR